MYKAVILREVKYDFIYKAVILRLYFYGLLSLVLGA